MKVPGHNALREVVGLSAIRACNERPLGFFTNHGAGVGVQMVA